MHALQRVLFAALITCLGIAHAAEVRVIGANAIKQPFLEMAAAFEKASGNTVIAAWGGTESVAKRVRGGEMVDVVIIAAPNIDQLVAEGKIAPGSRVDFAKSLVGVAVRAGLARPDISSAEAVKAAILNANSIAYSSGPSGFYIADLLKRMGIAEQVKGKVKQPPSGVQVGELVARGEADLAFQQVSELVNVKGLDYLGPLPAEIQNVTIYAAALHVAAPQQAAAKALLKFLTGPDADAVLKKVGLERGQ